jgi:hypothetical protein
MNASWPLMLPAICREALKEAQVEHGAMSRLLGHNSQLLSRRPTIGESPDS